MLRARPFLLLSGACWALVLLIYVFALGTHAGRTVDRRTLLNGPAGPRWQEVHDASSHLVHTIDVSSLALAAVAIVGIALVRRLPGHALAAAVTIAGAIGTTEVLKPALGAIDPLGGNAARAIGSSFPSGHATVAMSVTLALLIVVPPAWRPAAAVLAALYSGVVGIGLVLVGAHFPSDVAGGYLVACAWAAAACAGLAEWTRRHPESDAVPSSRAIAAGAAAALSVAFAIVLLVALAAVRGTDLGKLEPLGRLHTSFFATSGGLLVLAALVPAVLAAMLLRDHLRGAPRMSV
ncbi:MAG: phosphatase PAP2 family protein [Thermoleophilaceae bacterium]